MSESMAQYLQIPHFEGCKQKAIVAFCQRRFQRYIADWEWRARNLRLYVAKLLIMRTLPPPTHTSHTRRTAATARNI